MRFASELTVADKEIARVRLEVAHADSAVMSPLTPIQERAAASRAAAYVWLAATLERIVRDAIQTTLREISVVSPPLRDLRLSLFALLCEGEFDSISTRSRNKSWEAKINVFQRTMESTPTVLSEAILPLDGRTIRAEHFDTIWLVLGLPNDSTPSPIHRIALRDLADGRNEVAHGHKDPVAFGRRKATTDLLKLAMRIEEVITHLLTGLDAYIDGRLYVR